MADRRSWIKDLDPFFGYIDKTFHAFLLVAYGMS
jgi:hypothetical protein